MVVCCSLFRLSRCELIEKCNDISHERNNSLVEVARSFGNGFNYKLLFWMRGVFEDEEKMTSLILQTSASKCKVQILVKPKYLELEKTFAIFLCFKE